jgi:zinc protease
MKRELFILLSLVLSVAAAALAGEKEFRIPYKKYTLSNGLNVLLHVDRSNPIVAVYIVYHVGSAREEKGRTGFAHLFEHLRFNESQNIPQGEWFRKLQGAGATNVNGSTNNDRTNYYEVVPKNALEMALWMEADRMGFLLSKFNEKTFITQQNVVQNEKRRGDNSPYSQAGYILGKLMYPETHPYNWQVIGSLEDLSNAKLQDAVDFHTKYYGPSNATLVVAGDIDPAQAKKWIDRYFAEIPSSPKPKALDKMPVTLSSTRRAYFQDQLANAPMLTMAFPTVEEYSGDSYALQFLARILGGSKKSALYKVLVEEKKLAPSGTGGGGRSGGGASVSASQRSRELAGMFEISVRAFPAVKLGRVEAAITEAFARFEKEGFTIKDVERQKAGLEYRFYNTIDSVFGKATTLGNYNMTMGTPDFMATDLQNTMSVTVDDVWRVYNRYIKNREYVLFSIVPQGKADQAAPHSSPFIVLEESVEKAGTRKDVGIYRAAPIASKIDRRREPSNGPDPLVKVPAIWTGRTTYGTEVFGVQKSELPLVEFSIIIKGGMLLDPPGKAGLGYLTGRLMNEGTRSKTAIDLREAIEDLGANISIAGGEESITLSGSCLSPKLIEVFTLAKEMLLEPRWDEHEFGLAKSQVIELLKRTEATPSNIASRVFDKLVYGTDSYLANQAMGTVKSVESITLDDLKTYYAKNFSPSVAKVTVVGDISKENACQLFESLKDWQVKGVKFPEIRITQPSKPGIYFVDIPRAKQSVFNVGHLGPAASDPDFYKAVVMNHKLGGDFSGILNMILRETKSFTYGARSAFTGNSNPGTFKATVDVQTNATLETAQILRDEISKYRNGISAADLNLVKSTLLKSNVGRFETLQQLAAMLNPIITYGLPVDYVKQRESFVQKLTLDEVKALAQKYIQPDKLFYVIVGDKETEFDPLKGLGLGEPVLVDKEANAVSSDRRD